MIIFNISGGLGNQFFQYAFGRYLAIQNQTDLHLRFESYQSDPARKPKLDYFNTSYKLASEERILEYSSFYCRLHPFFKKIYRKERLVLFKRYFNDKTEPWYKKQLKQVTKGYFDGYWSFEDYFKEIRPILLEELELKDELKQENFLKIRNEVTNKNSVAIHIRRGDYISNQKFAQIFNQLPIDYYKKAVLKIEQSVKNPVFYVFSDDVEWVKTNFAGQIGVDLHFIADYEINADYIEFSLMKSCKHFIIANSTFSWWAAWLGGTEKNKRVIAPKDWYKDRSLQRRYNKNSFVPDSWIKL